VPKPGETPWLNYTAILNNIYNFESLDLIVSSFSNQQLAVIAGTRFLRKLTKKRSYNLRFDMKAQNNSVAYAVYSDFNVNNSDNEHSMTFEKYLGGTAGTRLLTSIFREEGDGKSR